MTSPFTLTVQDPATLGLPERMETAQLQYDCFTFANPDDPPPVLASVAESLHRVVADERRQLVQAHREGRLIGLGYLDYDLEQNTDKAHLHVAVHPACRCQGVGTALASRLAEVALALGRVTYTAATSSRSPQGDVFATGLGAEASLPSIMSELRLDALDQAQLAAWVTRPTPDAYRLHRFTHIPEHELARAAAVVSVMNTAPRGTLDFDDWIITAETMREWQDAAEATGWERLFYAVEQTESGELVAFSEVQWQPERGDMVFQQGTGVRPDHRGQGLGKWLKAAVLLDLPVAFPAAVRVRTGNADSNAAMLGINVALGFKPASSATEWQGQTQELLKAAVRQLGTSG